MARVVASHEEQRGEIVRLLMPYAGLWVTLRRIQKALMQIGIALPNNPDLQFHLRYLANAEDGAIIEGQQRSEQAGWHPDKLQAGETAGDIVLVKLTNRGVNMYDRKVDCDPGIDFGW